MLPFYIVRDQILHVFYRRHAVCTPTPLFNRLRAFRFRWAKTFAKCVLGLRGRGLCVCCLVGFLVCTGILFEKLQRHGCQYPLQINQLNKKNRERSIPQLFKTLPKSRKQQPRIDIIKCRRGDFGAKSRPGRRLRTKIRTSLQKDKPTIAFSAPNASLGRPSVDCSSEKPWIFRCRFGSSTNQETYSLGTSLVRSVRSRVLRGTLF